ncbi:MAG: hypothetical protein Kow006_11750 [Gammaproteobacteria bacterium]
MPEQKFSHFDTQVIRWVCLVGTLILTPFAILHGLRGDRLLLTAVGGLTLVMAVTAWQLWVTRTPVSLKSLMIGMVICNLAVFLAGLRFHSEGMYWAFAAVSANSFLLGPGTGLLYSASLGIAMSLSALSWAATSEVIRFVASYTLLTAMVYLFSHRVRLNEERFERLACTDPLTGIGNRRLLESALEQELAKARRLGYMASLIAIDLDHFKEINDRHGHAVGDRFLQEFAAMIRRRLRKSDSLFRVGGEEFLVLAPGTSSMGAFELAESLRMEMPATSLAGLSGNTFSAGVSELHESDTPDSWLIRADKALYRAKENGRDRVVLNIEPPSEPPPESRSSAPA